MSILTNTRQVLADLIQEVSGSPAFPYLPNKLTAPSSVVIPDDPYLESGETFGTFTAALKVTVLLPSVSNELVTLSMDALVEDLLVALVNAKYSAIGAGKPYMIGNESGAKFLATDITLTTTIRF